MWQGRMSLRAIWARVKNLPPGSALSRQVDPEQWRAEHYILADIHDITAIAGGVTERGTKDPPRYERPGDRVVKAQKQAEMDRKIVDSNQRFKRQLAAGGDFDE